LSNQPFVTLITFQVKPDKAADFESRILEIQKQQRFLPGCRMAGYFKRFYTFDGVETGLPPREITKIIKCIKYYAWLEFESIEACGQAKDWFFETHLKEINKLLIMPFDMNSGYTL